MDKTKIQMIYNVETFGNTRRITARLPSQFNNKLIELEQNNKSTIASSHLIGDSIRNIKFIYTYDLDKDAAFVKFEIHRFVKNLELIELLIKLGMEKLEEIE